MKEIKNIKLLVKCLEFFNDSATHKISERVGDLEEYAHKLMMNAKNYCIIEYNKLLGFISFYANQDDTAYLAIIAVSQTHKGKGIGSKMLVMAMNIARIEGMKLMRLEVDRQNAPAIQFYEKHGFKFEKFVGDSTVFMIRKV